MPNALKGPRDPYTTITAVVLFAVAALMIWRAPHLLDSPEGWTRVAVPLAAGVGLLKAADSKGSA